MQASRVDKPDHDSNIVSYIAVGAGLVGGLAYVAESDEPSKKPAMIGGMMLGGAAGAVISDYLHHRNGRSGGPSLALVLPPTTAGARAITTWRFW